MKHNIEYLKFQHNNELASIYRILPCIKSYSKIFAAKILVNTSHNSTLIPSTSYYQRKALIKNLANW